MNATFLAALKANGGPGSDICTVSGTIPGHVRPPAEPSPGFVTETSPAPRSSQVQVVSAAPSAGGGVQVSTAEPPASSAPMAPAGSLENSFGFPR